MVQAIPGNLPLLAAAIAGVSAPLAAWLAFRRARNALLWFVLGALTGPIGIVLLALAPPGRCPWCDTPVPGWAARCSECGGGVRGDVEPDEPWDEPAADLGDDEDDRRGAGDREAPIPLARHPRAAAAAAPGRSVVTPIAEWDARRRSAGARRAVPASESAPPPAAAPAAAVSAAPSDEPGRMLTTALYLSGNVGLEVGACYGLSLVGQSLQVVGPVDAGQLTLRREVPLGTIEVTGLGDQVIVAGRPGGSSMLMVMRAVGGLSPADLEAALAAVMPPPPLSEATEPARPRAAGRRTRRARESTP